MKAFVLLATCGLAAVAGCQVSGDRDVDTTHRPSVEASTGYTLSYEATRDTEWAASSAASAQRGPIRQGEKVMFNRSPDPAMEWQEAKVNGVVRYVQPNAFRVATSR